MGKHTKASHEADAPQPKHDAMQSEPAKTEPTTNPVATGVKSESPALDEKRKTALLRYMGVLFCVAFLLVLLSLILQTHSSKSTISELSAASTSALDNAVKLQEQNRALQEEKQQLEDELDAVQKKLDEETALNDQLLQATQDEQSDAKQELRDKEQELDHTRLAYEALLTAMNCDTHEGNVTFSRAMETVARYQECLSENALAEFEKLQEQ